MLAWPSTAFALFSIVFSHLDGAIVNGEGKPNPVVVIGRCGRDSFGHVKNIHGSTIVQIISLGVSMKRIQ